MEAPSSPASTLAARLDGWEPFENLVAAAARRAEPFAAGGLWGSSQALVLAGLARRSEHPLLVLVASEGEVAALVDDLETFGVAALPLPARGEGADGEALRRRLEVAQRFAGPAERRPRLIVASQLAALEPLPSAQEIETRFLHLQLGQHLVPEELLSKLVAAGYRRAPLAEAPGEVSLRGDILDIYAFAAEWPLRVELFDDAVESLRSFDPQSQRSIEHLNRASLCLAGDAGGVEDGSGTLAAELVGARSLWVEIEPLRLADQRQGLAARSSAHARALERQREALERRTQIALQSLPAPDAHFDGRSVQALAVGLEAAPAALSELVGSGQRVLVACRTEPETRRLSARLSEAGATGVEVAQGGISKGFRLPALELVVVAHHELAGLAGVERRREERTPHRARALRSFFELKAGDLVVHAVHGLALFRGLAHMTRGGADEEHLHLEFAEEVSLFVPATRVDLVQRYIGTGSATPPLDKLGGMGFRRRKERVGKALIDLAADLLEVQALRAMRRRPAWSKGDELVADMLATFPHEDTPDQATSGAEIEADLVGERPMDRLLCGDVGFGKTELAMRAAFRVVAAGGQVAVLVPTTVLSEQHLETFRERLLGLPVRVEELSRLHSPKEARATLADVASGRVDILIGTHRILSKDVRFQHLGLVVIDEEQRFGVKHKEHLKRLRAQVDVLTLTATPIPRTLHMSLAGVRDISALTTPPTGRLGVETVLMYDDESARIRDALLREKGRGGKTFFLHNRVYDIELFTEQLRALVPECSFAIGHGQMDARELATVMTCFSHGSTDVLVSTTIVENGIDIPAAGTIMIHQADRFGLAELHQLRGRVGRGSQQAWCFLLMDRTRPLRGAARDRLKALEELSHLGAGFQISMKDLELRGAGNLLGPEQSGHIAAIGYDMYCRLLKETIERMQTGSLPSGGLPANAGGGDAGGVELELGVSAYLPAEWIPSADTRLELLRTFDGISGRAEARRAAEELRDRFGRVPPQAETLLELFALRTPLHRCSVRRLAWRDDAYLVEYEDRVSLEALVSRARAELRPLRAGVALLLLPPQVRDPRAGLAWLGRLLHDPDEQPTMAAR
jgi:transcription-repair coupling factor (superfamily II helicase)